MNEILWGYEDPVLQSLHRYLPNMAKTSRFGYFLDYNNSYSKQFEVYSGQVDISDWCIIKKWGENKKLNIWNSEWANQINGTDGFGVPPLLHKDDKLYVFIDAVCRSLYLTYSHLDYDTKRWKYTLTQDVLAAADEIPDNMGFCPDGMCAKSGLLNVTKCAELQTGMGAPVFVSQPHFLNADKTLREAITGMKPDNSHHGTFLSLDPITGFISDAAKRFQINIYTTKDNFNSSLIPDGIFIPAVWFDQTVKSMPKFQYKMDLNAKLLYCVQRYPVGLFLVSIIGLLFSVPFSIHFRPVYHLVDSDNESLISNGP